ncbi:MAG: class I SAM-dependent methyltransferase [Acidobacteria bacterium]|nr:class I SAM-dependent methyltransferase [Acidobacteriota bacterium]
MISDATQRFSSRVENYVRYRPGYPPEVLALLQNECGLTEQSTVADLASGTGIFTRTLLETGCRVFGVEPNDAMRQAGEQFLAAFPRFTSVKGAAEATTLPDHSVDIVTAAQAGHWFDRQKSRQEFLRILKPQGWLVLVWNERQTDSTPFLRAYEQLLLTYGTDYESVRHEHATTHIRDFFAPAPYIARVFSSRQEFDFPALEGRLLSSSYAPPPADPTHPPMLAELRRIFDEFQTQGRVSFEYHTRVYFGRLD